MKIAREMFDALDNAFILDVYEDEQARAVSLIAAFLYPVRDALKEIIDIEQDNNQGMQTCVEKLAEETLAMFEKSDAAPK